MDALLTFIQECKSELKSQEQCYLRERVEIENFINEKILNSVRIKNLNVHSRVKSIESIGEKIIRKNAFTKFDGRVQDYIENLKDIIGVRITCLFHDQEQEVHSNLVKKFNEYVEDGFYKMDSNSEYPLLMIKHNHQPEVQKNGRDIFRMECKWIISQDLKMNFELQIKSLVHMFWGEIEHELMYKNYHFIKDHDFYSNILGNMNDLLHLMDKELNSIQKHMNSLKKVEDKSRKADFFLQELSMHLQTEIEKVLDVEIDLREVYKLLLNNFVKLKSSQEFNMFIGMKLLEINQVKLRNSDFEIFDSEISIPRVHCDWYRRMYEVIKDRILSHDLYWTVTFVMHKKLSLAEEENKFREFVDGLLIIQLEEKLLDLKEKVSGDVALLEELEDSQEGEVNSISESLFGILSTSYKKALLELLRENAEIDIFLKGNQEWHFIDILSKSLDLFYMDIVNIDLSKLLDRRSELSSNIDAYFKLMLDIRYYYERVDVDGWIQILDIFQNGDMWLQPLNDEDYKYLKRRIMDNDNFDEDTGIKILKLLLDRGGDRF